MKGINILKKMTSRKFLISLGGFLMGLFALLKVDHDVSVQVVGLILSGISIAGYLIAETSLDQLGMENNWLSNEVEKEKDRRSLEKHGENNEEN